MAEIQGNNVTVEISTDSGTTYKTLICETRSGIQITRDTTQTQTKCNAGTTVLGLGAYSWSMSFDAVVDTAPSGSQVTYNDMLGWVTSGTALTARIEEAGEFTHEGSVYVTDLSLDAATGEAVSFSGTLSGTGALTIA
jgi:predicted secreted protein